MSLRGADAPEVWIADTAPIVLLAKIGRLDLLTSAARELILPSPVVREIRQGLASDPARIAVEAGWGARVPVRYTPVAVRSQGGLDRGEQSVLALALKRPGCRVVLDDEDARKVAKRLGLPMIGTLGVIILAKRQDRIPAIAPLFREIRNAGAYIADDLLRQLTAGEGEVWP